MHIISGLECGSTAISPLFWIKSAGTWAFQSCGDTAEGNWLSQRPGNCFRIPWVIILFCSWKASVGYKSSLNRVIELQICQPDAHVHPRVIRKEQLWALNTAFVPEWMSVFPFCKKLYLLRLWLCFDKATLLFSEGITWLQRGTACSPSSRGSCAIENSHAGFLNPSLYMYRSWNLFVQSSSHNCGLHDFLNMLFSGVKTGRNKWQHSQSIYLQMRQNFGAEEHDEPWSIMTTIAFRISEL